MSVGAWWYVVGQVKNRGAICGSFFVIEAGLYPSFCLATLSRHSPDLSSRYSTLEAKLMVNVGAPKGRGSETGAIREAEEDRGR